MIKGEGYGGHSLFYQSLYGITKQISVDKEMRDIVLSKGTQDWER
jgi:hypothetical protein